MTKLEFQKLIKSNESIDMEIFDGEPFADIKASIDFYTTERNFLAKELTNRSLDPQTYKTRLEAYIAVDGRIDYEHGVWFELKMRAMQQNERVAQLKRQQELMEASKKN